MRAGGCAAAATCPALVLGSWSKASPLQSGQWAARVGGTPRTPTEEAHSGDRPHCLGTSWGRNLPARERLGNPGPTETGSPRLPSTQACKPRRASL